MNKTFHRVKSLIVLSTVSVLSFTACKKDKACEVGFEGNNCQIESRAKFMGAFIAKDRLTKHGAPIPEYKATVTEDETMYNRVSFNNFSNGFVTKPLRATVVDDHFYIYSQMLNDTTSISGGGNKIDNNSFSIEYTIIYNNGDTLIYDGVWTKE